jgi:hypothetical protein
VPARTDVTRPPAELRTFDVRDWWDDVADVDHGLLVARAHQLHVAACTAWMAATGLPIHRPAEGETWARYWQRVGRPPPGTAAVMRARLPRHL